MSGRIQGKVSIVTGGASGFGEGIVRRFVAEGSKVVIADLNEDKAKVLIQELEEKHGKGVLHFIKCDVSDRDDVQKLINETIKTFQRVDVMVNNAGVSHRNQSLLTIDDKMANLVWQVNVLGIWHSAMALIPIFQKQGGGIIINNTSSAALRPRPGLTLYNASKAAAVNLTKTMAVELAPHNIRVNALCPVASDTPMLATFMGDDTPELRAKFISSVPLGRFSTPADLAGAALYLASDDAAFISGVALEVDGGRCV